MLHLCDKIMAMKKIKLLIVFLFFTIASHAQSNGNVVVVRVYESVNSSKDCIIIAYGNNKTEVIPLENFRTHKDWQVITNTIADKINSALTRLIEEGYTIVTSNAGNLMSDSMLTTYILRKQ